VTVEQPDKSQHDGHQPNGYLARCVEISKAFGHVQALRSVTFDIERSEVLALLGDNGAGKSTLVKILSGVYHPDSGQFLKDGEPVDLNDPTAALNAGIATVYQDLAVVDSMDVARNVYLGRVPRRFGFLVDFPRMYRDARQVLKTLRIDLPSVQTRVGELSGGQRQAVAIARALAVDASLFLMDEPTAALGVAQTEKVNEVVADLKSAGKTVVIITHNLDHVFQIADRIVVLRRGLRVGVRRTNETTREEIVGLITGAIVGDAPAVQA
jgi:ABC-type sugar transport system ATPase subunit